MSSSDTRGAEAQPSVTLSDFDLTRLRAAAAARVQENPRPTCTDLDVVLSRLFEAARARGTVPAEPPADPCLELDASGPTVVARVTTCGHCIGGHVIARAPYRGGEVDVAALCPVCTRLHAHAARLTAAQLPSSAGQYRFASWQVTRRDDGPGDADHRREALEACKAFGSRADAPPVILYGPTGTGKTHLLLAMAWEVVRQRREECLYLDATRWLARIQATFGRRRGSDEPDAREIIAAAAAVPVLFLDEFGAGQGTPWEVSTMDRLVVERYSARRPTIVATNYGPTRPSDGGEWLGTRIGEHAVSRLREGAVLLPLTGPDWRLSRAPVTP